MNYEMVDQLISSVNLSDDPAFDALRISIQPTPNLNGCPLGLYYPDSGLIVIQPDAQDAVLLHELGHRYGHYYHQDLSETYAESFREKYQKGTALLYSGNDFRRMPKFGVLFNEGQKGVMEIALRGHVNHNDLIKFKNQFYEYSNGESIPRFFYGGADSPWIRVEFTRGVDWVVITGAVLSSAIIAGIFAIGYSIYKVSRDLPWVIPVTLAGLGAVMIFRSASKRGYIGI